MWTENILKNSIGSVIETDTSIYPPGYVRMYHAITRDWITNEIFRRVEPQGRTMGQYIRDEICPEIDVQVVCGANEQEIANIRNFRTLGKMECMKLLWKGPKNAPVAFSLFEFKNFLNKLKEIGADLDTIFPKQKNSKAMEVDFPCKDALDFAYRYSVLNEARRGEYPSYLMHSNAKSIAKLAAFMANKGFLNEKVLISEDSWDKMHSDQKLESNHGFN